MVLGRAIFSILGLTVLASAAGAADMAPMVRKAPPEALPQATGYVELYGGGASTKRDETFCTTSCGPFSSFEADGWVLGGAGRANYWWASNASLQLDAQAEGTSYSFPSPSTGHFSSHGYLVGGHLNWRNPHQGLFGIFGGVGDATSSIVTFTSVRHGLIGLEGQAYWGALTLYGQVGYDSTLGNVGFSLDSYHAWFARGTARLYVNPNLRLEGTVLYANGGVDFVGSGSTEDFETWLWRVKAEHKFAASPFSIFATYEGSRTTIDFATTNFATQTRISDHRIMGGIRLYLGENTLQWNDNRGATLDIIAPLGVPSAIFSGGVLN